ncbi:pilus assembly protein PilP [uncultured Desulfobacter sp.]|uniref:pilus assembly protein PilP n=1 Tax=uncultured Desulfobacter sp. TaxID=240139 RepID=UPI002AA93740|nr:pilus assembly protein PilP [uncultured Desulfobacter sp.]
MQKIMKIFCVVGLGVLLLFVSACNEEPAPNPKITTPSQVVSKPISKSNPSAKKSAVSGDAEKKQASVSDVPPARNFVKNSQIGSGIDGSEGLQKTGISKPMAKYNSNNRVDPFVPLIAEKNVSAESDSSEDSKPKRTLTPLEKLALSQVKLVAVVEMQNRTIAMVEEATGKGYEVAVGTYIGPNGGRVTAITQEGIKIEEKAKDYQGKHHKRYEEIKFHKSEDGE